MKTFTKVLFVLIALSLVYPLSGDLLANDAKKEVKVKKCAVCKTAIAKDAPEIKTEYKGKTYYFASEICKEKFLKDPDKYAKACCEKKIEYVCKDCKFHADKPGKCPKCGKELKKHEAACCEHGKTVYCCEKCNYHSDKPGKCPKCGKELEKHEQKIAYVCPMKQCNYKTDKPGKCPKCGMKLKKATLQDHAHGHDQKHEHKEGEKHEHKRQH